MQSAFSTFLELGFKHILDPNGYDHILFVIALCAVYSLKEWRTVAILVTAFTVGHSLTLALAALDVVRMPAQLIETLIPITIILTALYNAWKGVSADGNWRQRTQIPLYGLTVFFGLIHGLGFSNFFRSSLLPGEQGQLITQLLAFNIGVELGQLLVVGLILLTAFLAFQVLKIPRLLWVRFISGVAAGMALSILLG
jgi:hypothetical protein